MATKRVRQLSTIAGALLVLLAAPGAFAQCPKYRIVNLGSLGTNEQSEESAAVDRRGWWLSAIPAIPGRRLRVRER